MENKFTRVAETDPDRCQGVFRGGQCPYKAHPGSKYCLMHGGNKAAESARKKDIHDFKLTQWQERMDEFAGSARVKSLRGEIGITRMTLEKVLNEIKNPNQFPLYVDKISSLVTQIERLVNSAQKLEERNRDLLGKNEVFLIADQVINILGLFIDDPDKLLEANEKLNDSINAIICGEGALGSTT